MANASRPSASKKRVRLAPEIRKQLILDAAITEFGTHGFGGSSTARIAQRAGLSQAGLYAHFKRKEDILESLFNDTLLSRSPPWESNASPELADLETMIDEGYALVSNPKVLAVMRILIVEGSRVPQLIAQWRNKFIQPHLAQRQALLDALVASGKIQRNALTRHATLLLSPLVHLLVMHLVQGTGNTLGQDDIDALRQAHGELLRELVVMRTTPTPDTAAATAPLV